MDFDEGVDRFLVDMRGELSKYQLWLRRRDNQLIVHALVWQMSSSAIFYLQRLDSLRTRRRRHFLKKVGVFCIWYNKKAFVFPRQVDTNRG